MEVCKPALDEALTPAAKITREEFEDFHDHMTSKGLTDDESRQIWLKLQAATGRKRVDVCKMIFNSFNARKTTYV